MTSKPVSCITDGIRIDVRSAYAEEDSSPKHSYFEFVYQVDIINESGFEVQLLRRSWDIVDGLGIGREAKGLGVVGKQPLILPGDSYRYVSRSYFSTPIGMMSGQYLMERCSDGSQFWVIIPAFTLQIPYLNN